MSEEERLSDIYFQLSSLDRRKIIEELLKESLKLNEIAKKLDLTATEAFRQLQRLTDAGLLEKIPDGKYRSTPYAKLVLESASALNFLSKHKEHLMDRDTSLLPPEYRARLGELSNAVLKANMITNLNDATEAFKRAKKRLDLMVEQRLEVHGQIINQKISEGVKTRFLMQESMLATLPKGPPPERKSLSEVKVLPKVCAMVILIDDTAVISFPKLDSTMDYAIFVGEDAASVKWASDLFEDQWKKAKPLRA
jgi:predicted transcriptional regulator